MNNFRRQRTFLSRWYKKKRKNFYFKIDINEITDNKPSWKTTTRFLSSKAPRSLRITLIEMEAIVSEDKKHCVKSDRIRSYSGPHSSLIFPHSDWMRRDTEYLSVFSPNAGKCDKNADQNNSEYGHFLVCAFLLVESIPSSESHCLC